MLEVHLFGDGEKDDQMIRSCKGWGIHLVVVDCSDMGVVGNKQTEIWRRR